jgi:uncharacterized membrane protein
MFARVSEVLPVTKIVWDDAVQLPVSVTTNEVVTSWKWTDVETFNENGKAFNGNYKAVFVAILFTLFLLSVIVL